MLDHATIVNRLLTLSEREKHYRKDKSQLSAVYYERLKKRTINGQEAYIFDALDLIPADQKFNIVQHTRYVPVPLHVHNFIELNYVYSGNCRQVIGGTQVNLSEGQICLIDTDVPHAIGNTDVGDIIINILVKRDYFVHQLTQEPYGGSVVFDFVLKAMSESQNHDQYIVFEKSEDQKIRTIMDQILAENFEPGIGSTKIIENFISILFTMLVRIFD